MSGGGSAGASAREAATAIVRRLRGAGHEAWLVGGCVREALLGREPSDFDVATDAVPARIAELFQRVVPVGERFGVVLVVEQGVPTEVATFRTESGHADGRRPADVRFSTAEEDVVRRDFTVNALLMDPETGRVVDHVGGREDLEARLLRTVGDPRERFAEDHLRLLRAVRFASRLHLEIEPATFAALREHAPSIERIAAERVRDELTKMFVDENRFAALRLLDETGLLAIVLPEVHALHGVEQPRDHHPEGDVFVHSGLAMRALPPDVSERVAWATLLHDIGKPAAFERRDGRIRFHGHEVVGADMADAILRRLRFSNATRESVRWLVRSHLRLRDAPRMKRSTLRRLLAEPLLPDLLVVARADALGGSGDVSHVDFVAAARDAEPDSLPAPLVDGRDLRALHLDPGPEYGRLLRRLRDEQLDGRLETREQALRRLRELVSLPEPPAGAPD